eukprot:scaffold40255_cov66-Phaeocystis_antarctica.AAC.1
MMVPRSRTRTPQIADASGTTFKVLETRRVNRSFQDFWDFGIGATRREVEQERMARADGAARRSTDTHVSNTGIPAMSLRDGESYGGFTGRHPRHPRSKRLSARRSWRTRGRSRTASPLRSLAEMDNVSAWETSSSSGGTPV